MSQDPPFQPHVFRKDLSPLTTGLESFLEPACSQLMAEIFPPALSLLFLVFLFFLFCINERPDLPRILPYTPTDKVFPFFIPPVSDHV